MASQRATTGPDVIASAASPTAAVTSPSAARHGYYSKQPRDDDDDDDVPAQRQPEPPPTVIGCPPVTPLHRLTNKSAVVDCPFCDNRVQTQIEDNDSHTTIISGIGFGFFCPCIACLPCCRYWFQDVDHYCPCCQQRLAHVPYSLPDQVVAPAPGTMMTPLSPPSHPRRPYATGRGHPSTQAAAPAPPQMARYA